MSDSDDDFLLPGLSKPKPSPATTTSASVLISGPSGTGLGASAMKPKEDDYASSLLSGLRGGGGRPGGRPGGRQLSTARRNPFGDDSPPSAPLAPPAAPAPAPAVSALSPASLTSPASAAQPLARSTGGMSDDAAAEAVMRAAGILPPAPTTTGPSAVNAPMAAPVVYQSPPLQQQLQQQQYQAAPSSSAQMFATVNAPTVPPTPSAAATATFQPQQQQYHSPQQQVVASPAPVVVAAPQPVVVVAAAPPPPPPPPAVDAETVAKLRKQVEEKKLMLQQLEEREKDLAEKQKQEVERHTASLATLDEEIRKVWLEAEAERTRCDQQVREAEEEQENLLRSERKRIDDEVGALNKPRIDALTEELRQLRERRTQLSQSLNMTAANKDAVTDAVAAAVKTIAERMESHYQRHVAKDEQWERHIRDLIRKEIRTSFATAAASEGESEREEYKKAFDSMLQFWREAEEDNKAFLTKLDDQMMQDLKSVALEDMRRVQGEEQRVQEVYMEARESWARYHRNNLTEELEAAIQRRSTEFEELRASRQQLHVEQVNQIERSQKEVGDARAALHEKELATIRSFHHERELMAADRSKMILAVQEDAAKATQSLSDTIQGVNKALLKLEQYKLTIDDGREQLDADRKKNLEMRSTTLADVQSIVLSQANAVETERKALSSALVKLQVVQRSVETQMEDERAWIASMGAKMERSRGDWEREYRRWQQVAQQEKLDAEQRFSNILMDLRKTAVGLEQQGNDLEVEANALRRYCTERSVRQSNELKDLQRREAELAHRHDDLLRLLQDLEGQGKGISSQWEELHRERQQLAQQRDELRQEEIRMQSMADNLRSMRAQFDAASGETARVVERNRASHHQLAVTRDAVSSDMAAVKDQSERLLKQKEQLAREQHRVGEAVMGSHNTVPSSSRGGGHSGDKHQPAAIMDRPSNAKGGSSSRPRVAKGDPNRLPQQVLGELRTALTQSLANVGGFGQQGAGVLAIGAMPNDRQPQQRAVAAHHHHHNTVGAGAGGGGGNNTTFFDQPSRITNNGRGYQDPNSMHFTRLVGMSEFETTSVSQLGRGDSVAASNAE